MAKLSSMILSQWEPVHVGIGKKGDLGAMTQTSYARSRHSIQTSAGLKSFQSCVRKEMGGKNFNDRQAVRSALTSAAHSCKGK